MISSGSSRLLLRFAREISFWRFYVFFLYQEMNQKKKITDDHVEILRKKSETLRQEIEREEKKLLNIITSLSLAK